jgi:anti-sigma factor RsiW
MHSDPMLTKLGAYLDAELPSGEAAAVQKHTGSCPQCAAEIAALVTLQRSLRVVRGHFTPSVEFRRRIQRQIGAPPRRPPARCRSSFLYAQLSSNTDSDPATLILGGDQIKPPRQPFPRACPRLRTGQTS